MKKSFSFRAIFLSASLVLQLSIQTSPLCAAAGDVDLSFDPGSGVNGTVNAVAVQPDGKIVIGGDFTTVKGLARTGIARLNADGSGDPSFNPSSVPAGTVIAAIHIQLDGKLIICGTLNGNRPNGYAARLGSNGSNDTAFVAATGTFLYGSEFTSLAVQADGKVILGGYFTDYFADGGDNYPQRARVIRLNVNGTTDDSFPAVVGQYFTRVSALALQATGKVIISGLTPNPVRLNANGTLDGTFNGSGVDSVIAMAAQSDDRILIGGYFLTVSGTARKGIARLNANGSLDTGFNPGSGIDNQGANGHVRAITVQADGKVLIAGEFTNFNGISRGHVARLNANGSLDSTFDPGTSAPVFIHSVAVQPDGKTLLVGRFFSSTNRDNVRRLQANGTLDSGFDIGRGIDGRINAVAVQTDGKVLIGGEFGAVQGTNRNRIARLHADGTLDTTFNPGTGVDGAVFAIAIQVDAKILIAGSFLTVNGTNRRCVARLNADGSLDTSFDSGANIYDHARALALQLDGKVIVGSTYGICRLNANGTWDSGYQPELWPGSSVLGLARQADGKVLVAGYSTTLVSDPINGNYEAFAARLTRVTTTGDADNAFASFVGTPAEDYRYAQAVAVQPDGKILLGGNFTTLHGADRHWIGRLQADGTLDATFDPGAGVTGFTSSYEDLGVKCIVVQSDGRVLISGAFSGADTSARAGIARLNPDGSVDRSFDPGTGPSGAVNSLALQPDARIVIGGSFSTVNGVARPFVARLQSNLPISFAGWAAAFGLSGVALAPDADPDVDGMSNAAEYLSGGNPSRASIAERPTLALAEGKVTFAFTRADASETSDIAVVLEASTDLLTWPDVFTVGATTAASSPSVTIVENGPAADTVTLTLPIAGQPRRFARMKVVVTP